MADVHVIILDEHIVAVVDAHMVMADVHVIIIDARIVAVVNAHIVALVNAHINVDADIAMVIVLIAETADLRVCATENELYNAKPVHTVNPQLRFVPSHLSYPCALYIGAHTKVNPAPQYLGRTYTRQSAVHPECIDAHFSLLLPKHTRADPDCITARPRAYNHTPFRHSLISLK